LGSGFGDGVVDIVEIVAFVGIVDVEAVTVLVEAEAVSVPRSIGYELADGLEAFKALKMSFNLVLFTKSIGLTVVAQQTLIWPMKIIVSSTHYCRVARCVPDPSVQVSCRRQHQFSRPAAHPIC